MERILLGSAALPGLAGGASAQSQVDHVPRQVRALDATQVEVDEGPALVGLGRLRERRRVEQVSSLAAGEPLSREAPPADGDADRTPRRDDGRRDQDVVDGRDRDDAGKGQGGRGGDRDHGNDEDGFDDPGRRHGSDGPPGRGGPRGRGRR